VPRSSFAWAGVFTRHRNFRDGQLSSSDTLGIKTLSRLAYHSRGARTLALRAADSFWQARYYDFNVWSECKFVEKPRYIHRNPVARGLVERPGDWLWSSFRHYATGVEGIAEIESMWTARKHEQMGRPLRVSIRHG